MAGNVPQKRSDLARDRNGRHGAALAFGDEPPITRAKRRAWAFQAIRGFACGRSVWCL